MASHYVVSPFCLLRVVSIRDRSVPLLSSIVQLQGIDKVIGKYAR